MGLNESIKDLLYDYFGVSCRCGMYTLYFYVMKFKSRIWRYIIVLHYENMSLWYANKMGIMMIK